MTKAVVVEDDDDDFEGRSYRERDRFGLWGVGVTVTGVDVSSRSSYLARKDSRYVVAFSSMIGGGMCVGKPTFSDYDEMLKKICLHGECQAR